MCVYDITHSTSLLPATPLSCQSPFLLIQRPEGDKSKATFQTGNGKTNPRNCLTKPAKTDWSNWRDSFLQITLSLTAALWHPRQGLMLYTFFSVQLQNFKSLYSSALWLLRQQNILERGASVVRVTSALRSGPKTNINTLKLNATTWWGTSFACYNDPVYHSGGTGTVCLSSTNVITFNQQYISVRTNDAEVLHRKVKCISSEYTKRLRSSYLWPQ